MKDLIIEWAEEQGIDITDENIDQVAEDYQNTMAMKADYMRELY